MSNRTARLTISPARCSASIRGPANFEIFCEGTSNPWGIAWNREGDAFASACVIDHLWHLIETGYYIRQGGPYPPFTWPIESIVKHQHQKAAYCGIHYFDSDAYPGGVSRQALHGQHPRQLHQRRRARAATARPTSARPRPDFLTANDAWFMPVSQKTGPDGCLYILDWYDRYHCYQDANRDPAGIDRSRAGSTAFATKTRRARRVRPRQGERRPADRAAAQPERLLPRDGPAAACRAQPRRKSKAKLEKLVLDESAPRKARMHALWARISCGPLETDFPSKAARPTRTPASAPGACAPPATPARSTTPCATKIARPGDDPSPRCAAADGHRRAARSTASMPIPTAAGRRLDTRGDDQLIPHIVWQNLHPLLEDHADEFLGILEKTDLGKSPQLAALMPRMVERILGRKQTDPGLDRRPVRHAVRRQGTERRRDAAVSGAAGEEAADRRNRRRAGDGAAREVRSRRCERCLAGKPDGPLYLDAAALAATLKRPDRTGGCAQDRGARCTGRKATGSRRSTP